MTVADKIASWLFEIGISHAFGITGAGNLPIWDALTRLGKTSLICTHHEQAAAFNAAYFNRVKGRMGAIVLCTTGAGSSNTITGVLSAYMDSVPLLVLSGNEPLATLNEDTRVLGVQGYGSSELATHFTKAAFRLTSWNLELMEWAYSQAIQPRQGPVWVDVPRDIASAVV